MYVETEAQAPNSLVVVHKSAAWPWTPDVDGIGVLWVNSSSIVLATYHFIDAPTRVVLTDDSFDPQDLKLLFSGLLDGDGVDCVVATVERDVLLQIRAEPGVQGIEVWSDDVLSEPTTLVVRLNGASDGQPAATCAAAG